MLKISNEQAQVFERAALHSFENRTLEHLQTYFPRHCEHMGETRTRALIRLGIDRAQGHGIHAERDICLYVSMMVMLGSDFDSDPQLPWTADILNDKALAGHPARMEHLHTRAMEHLDRVAGLSNEYSERALRRIRDASFSTLLPSRSDNLEDELVMQLQLIHPEKVAVVGSENLHQLIENGRKVAEHYDIAFPQGVGLVAGMMFLLGSGFDEDPQFAWAKEILTDQSISNRNERVQRLYRGAMDFLEWWMK